MRWLKRGSRGVSKIDMFRWSDWPAEFTYSNHPNFATDFPKLLPHLCANDVSGRTEEYNCIAWAAGFATEWWEPDEFFQYYWPDGIERKYTLLAFKDAYRTVGFEDCESSALEPRFEKIAIFTRKGSPLHAARQLPTGIWTSKFGIYEDIQHLTLESVSGPLYGIPHVYMKRSIRSIR